MFQLADGRRNVYQWDNNVKLLLDESNESADEVHFSARFSRVSLSVEVVHAVDSSYVTIPNILLQKPNDIIAYSYITNADGSYTKYDVIIPVIARPKPSGYIYEETEILTWKTLDDKIDDLGKSTADAVKYTEQELTDEQKMQARTNIGAVSVGEVVKPVTKTDEMSQDVGVDADGRLYTIPIASTMTGATADTDGSAGLVPAPKAGEHEKFLRGDGTWASVIAEGGLTSAQISALDGLFKIAAYTEDASTAYSAFKSAFGISDSGGGESGGGGETEKALESISATYSGGDVEVGTALSDLTGITVTATYSDGSTAVVTGYTLSGEIAVGENIITVTYDGMTTTFSVTGTDESSGGEEVSIDIQSLLTASGYYYDGYADVYSTTSHKGTSLDGGTTPAYAIELVAGATYTLKTAHNGDETGIYGPGAFSGSTDGKTSGVWRNNINKNNNVEKASEEIESGVYVLTYTFTAPTTTTFLSVGCLNGYVSYASLSYKQG